MKRLPMMALWALILFIVMAVPTAVLTIYSGAQMQRHSEEAVAESALAQLEANRKRCEMAMDTILRETVRLASTFDFNRLSRTSPDYAALNADYGHVSAALLLVRELQNMYRNMAGVHSLLFYLDGSDYLISSDYGIDRLERFGSIAWLEDALAQRVGISGVWRARTLASGQSVISFVLPLSRLTTSARGTLVANLLESQLYSYLSAGEPGERFSMILDADGNVVSGTDKQLLRRSALALPHIAETLGGAGSGYAFRSEGGENLLYTWQRAGRGGWTYVSCKSMDVLMSKAQLVRRNMLLLMALVLVLGTGTAATLATWLSRPVRELARSVRARGDLPASGRNELVFLNAAFDQIQAQEARLSEMLKARQQSASDLALHGLLDGELPSAPDLVLVRELLPGDRYRVAVVSLDGYARYLNATTPETRKYHRYLYMSQCEPLFSGGLRAVMVYRGEGNIAAVLSLDGAGEGAVWEALDRMRQVAPGVFAHTVTIGCSGEADGIAGLSECAAQAMEATKRRIIDGGDSVLRHQGAGAAGKYVYPEGNERRILNYLSAGDLPHIQEELAKVRAQILGADGIGYDNILFIYNQLVAATIRQLGEQNLSTARLFPQHVNVYAQLAALDTLPELEAYLIGFFEEIAQHFLRERAGAAPDHGERALRYLAEHYREELNFEDVAQLCGISYSHMRKCVKERTGMSLSDCVNRMRIEQAKRLMTQSDRSITQIAIEVGYQNVQSFNRFFHKYEGVAAGEYRSARMASNAP